MIAFDRIGDDYLSGLLRDKHASRITLITAGSPLSHIYQHYFPHHYPEFKALEKLEWVNIFRIDDYVGTKISGPAGFPDNRALGLGGHTKYWAENRTDAFDEIAKALPN